MIKIDTCGLSCPQPVILVMSELKQSDDALEIRMDKEESCSNVERILEKFERTFSVLKTANHTIYKVDKKYNQED